MNRNLNYVQLGSESIIATPSGLYHTTIEIDGKLYQNYDHAPLNGIQFILDVKKRMGAGKSSDKNITDMYNDRDIKISIDDDKYSVLLHILNRDFTLKTYSKSRRLRVLDAIGAKRSHRLVETYRASLARYAGDIIKYGSKL
ncbi:hypothetical protein [Ruminococcus flavefaciens]|uniref:hypothetical protein n=1 Tax=Ruminococcus flavefaciens TaxID=1265 RepID=UPI0026EBF338|nr:hypothetical protein [Ruminococcus flavefaciens]